ncbi:MAG: amino acid adenylation domain-containing protein, partial [Candidatus Hydrogenedentes bacterium]|nr:amino acid adenylation domain-containing protein [Candidatus Hydrogenedentota bacterium]
VGYSLARGPVEATERRTHLLKTLPPYMVPSWFVHMDAMPLNNNGKIDMAALPAPEFERCSADYVAPRTDREKILVALWEETLHVSRVGVEDSFFDLGGHSLLATRLIVRVEKQFSIRLSLGAFLETPTIAAHVQVIADAELEGVPIEAQAPLPKADRSRPIPLSFSQEQLWVLSKLEENFTTYNIPLLFSMTGSVDSMALQTALNHVVARHEVLRTVFVEENGVPAQRVLGDLDVPLTTISLLDRSAERQQESLWSSVRALAGKPMDLGKGPLIEAQLFQLDTNNFRLVLVIHHIVFDGWSISVLLDELADAYQQTVAGTSLSREPLFHQFADYALWQRQMLESAEVKRQSAYWKRKLAGPLPTLEVPLDHPRPPRQAFDGEVLQHSLSSTFRSALEASARRHRVTPFVLLLAGWKALLYRYTGQEDCIVGTALAGRSRMELESLIGFFVNTVAVRTQVARDLPFEKLVERIDRSIREAQENQDVPFERVVADCQAGREPSRSPIFQVMFVLHNTPEYSIEFSGITMRGEEISNGGSKFDLTMSVQPTEFGYSLNLEYNTALYKAATIETLLSRYEYLLADVVLAPERPVGQLNLSKAGLVEEPEELDAPQSQPAPDLSSDVPECLHTLFEERARNTPDTRAVTCEGFSLSYKKLNARANQVANYLVDHGAGPDTLVGLCLDRSIDTVVAILGVLKSGSAYVPMDPVYPAERMRLIIEDAQCPVVITHVAQRECFKEDGNTVILVLDDIETDLSRYSSENRRCETGADDLAYVIYTSGSTGKPKGALISHRNVTRLFSSMEPSFGFNEKDSWTLFHSYAFDFSVWEIWGAFLYGGRLVVVPYVVSRSPEYFYQLLIDEQITVLSQTPSAFKQLQYHEELQPLAAVSDLALRYVFIGGEFMALPGLASWYKRHGDETPRLVHVYGITETTVFVTYRPLSQTDTAPGTPSLIGKAIVDLALYVLDESKVQVGVGEVGELFVGGPGVCRGYLNRPELTAERFLPNPFPEADVAPVLYKTGDLVRLLDGDLEFIGRNDHQVQLRGFRVELGEIETVLNTHAQIRGAIVRAREDKPGDMRLVAYYLAKEELSLESLRSCLTEKLPGYMVPSKFIHLVSFPLTNNGKVDVDALPAPVTEVAASETSEAPRNDMERLVAEVWCSLLGLDRVGISDNFFELGGHSLLAIQVLTQINEKLETQLGLRDFFDSPTIESFALVAVSKETDSEDGAGSKWLLHLKKGSGIPFFCVKGAGDVGGSYDTFASAMGDSQPFYGFPDLDFDDLEQSAEAFTIEKLARRCIEEIVKIQPSGPYYVGGYSFGGVVAYEIARQFLEAGEKVPLIAMLDSAIPDQHEVPRGASIQYGLFLLDRIRVRILMLGCTWRMLVGYARDAIRVIARRMMRPGSSGAPAPGWRDYLRWIQLDTSVQYFLVQAGLVKPTIGERRLEMVEEQLVRHSTRSMVVSKQAMAEYKMKPIPARITLFRAEHNPWKTEQRDPTFGWSQYAEKGVNVVVVPGNHMVIIRWPYATGLGKALQREIDQLKGRDEQ